MWAETHSSTDIPNYSGKSNGKQVKMLSYPTGGGCGTCFSLGLMIFFPSL